MAFCPVQCKVGWALCFLPFISNSQPLVLGGTMVVYNLTLGLGRPIMSRA